MAALKWKTCYLIISLVAFAAASLNRFENMGSLKLTGENLHAPHVDCGFLDGSCVAVFEDSNNRVYWSTNAQGAWSSPVQLVSNASKAKVSCMVTTCMAVWVLDSDNQAEFALFRNLKWSVAKPVPIQNVSSLEFPSIHCSLNSSECMVAIVNDEVECSLFLAKTPNFGESWTISTVASRKILPNRCFRDPELVCTDQGSKCFLVSRTTEEVGAVWVAESTDVGKTWSTFAPLENSARTKQKGGFPFLSKPTLSCVSESTCFVTVAANTTQDSRNHVDISEYTGTSFGAFETLYSLRDSFRPSVNCAKGACVVAWEILHDGSNSPRFVTFDSLIIMSTSRAFSGLPVSFTDTNVFSEVVVSCNHLGECFSVFTNSVPRHSEIQLGTLNLDTSQPTLSPLDDIAQTKAPMASTQAPLPSTKEPAVNETSVNNSQYKSAHSLAGIIAGSISVPLFMYGIHRFIRRQGWRGLKKGVTLCADEGSVVGPSPSPSASQASRDREPSRMFTGLRNLPMSPPILFYFHREDQAPDIDV